MKDIRLYSTYLNNCKKDKDGHYIVFDGGEEYKKVDVLPREQYQYTVHLYPEKDTTDEKLSLNGYCDALFFRAVIYNEDLHEYFVVPKLLDGVNSLLGGIEFQIRFFKDQSVMIILNNKYKLTYYQTLEIISW